MSSIKKVAVLGLGTMGSGIAQVCAQAGFETVCREVNTEYLDRGMAIIRKNLAFAVSKGKTTQEEMDATLARLKPTVYLADLKDVDLVIEVVVEDMNIKRDMFEELDRVCPAHTIFASNTSSLSITEMASSTKRSAQFVGMHFFNPAFLMKLVEVIKGLETSDETMQIAADFVKALGKVSVTTKDNPGFIVNLLLIPYLIDAARVYENGLASAEDIDNAMKLGAGYPMGPLTLIDMIGVDVCVMVGDILYEAYKETRYNVPPLLRKMVMAGHLGRKSGKGFYTY